MKLWYAKWRWQTRRRRSKRAKPAPDSFVKLRPPVGIIFLYQNVFKNFERKKRKKRSELSLRNVTERKRRAKSRKLIVAVVTTTGRWFLAIVPSAAVYRPGRREFYWERCRVRGGAARAGHYTNKQYNLWWMSLDSPPHAGVGGNRMLGTKKRSINKITI